LPYVDSVSYDLMNIELPYERPKCWTHPNLPPLLMD